MRITIADTNGAVVSACAAAFRGMADVFVHQLDALAGFNADAIVSPANSFGFMDGGIDMAMSRRFGWRVQEDLQRAIRARRFGELLVGEALVVPTGDPEIRHVISAPTMRVPMQILDPKDVFLATRAAIAAAVEHGFSSCILPGMGTGCGRLGPAVAARQMRRGIEQGLFEHDIRFPASWREAQAEHFRDR